jgi:hypothetical protein
MAISKLRAAATVGARASAEGSTPQQDGRDLVNSESTDQNMQEYQLEGHQINTSGPNEDSLVFGPEREPRAANRPINKKIKKKDDIENYEPIIRATFVAGKVEKGKGSSSAITGAAQTLCLRPSQSKVRLDGSLRVEVKPDRVTNLSKNRAYSRESQSPASPGPALGLLPKPDGRTGGRVHRDSTGKARVFTTTACVRTPPCVPCSTGVKVERPAQHGPCRRCRGSPPGGDGRDAHGRTTP